MNLRGVQAVFMWPMHERIDMLKYKNTIYGWDRF